MQNINKTIQTKRPCNAGSIKPTTVLRFSSNFTQFPMELFPPIQMKTLSQGSLCVFHNTNKISIIAIIQIGFFDERKMNIFVLNNFKF